MATASATPILDHQKNLMASYKAIQTALGSAMPSGKVAKFEQELSLFIGELQKRVALLQDYDPTAYDAIPDMLVEFRKAVLKLGGIYTDLIKSFETATVAVSAASTAKDSSGVAKGIILIRYYAKEIQAIGKCIADLTQILVLILMIPVILTTKLLEMSAILVKAAADEIQKSLKELIDAATKELLKLKTKMATYLSNAFYSSKAKQIKLEMATINKELLSLKRQLSGMNPIDIGYQDIKNNIISKQNDLELLQALLQELADAGVTEAMTSPLITSTQILPDQVS